ncbi:N-acyl homoserine lactonase family protein [Arenibacter sp. GZD96]|uniref:N-acyl homoserine lactonase family protein n=1 Tax=Aurantibrevibacter litoralis TaxID=3106030 RepID=UPI002AFF4FA8|nr:N-acyl homoserine lactonase family protein [Arenibacter sp. GZD-96]MEA1787503.1 N-acyl homoserine lactonase family protein [Arenibacter sp. GZD-96]
MKRIVFLIIPLLFACKEVKKEDRIVESEKPSKPVVKLYTLDGGTIVVNNLQLFSQDTTYQGQSKEFANAFYVVSHPKGNLVWDTGLPDGLVGLPEPFTTPDGAFTVSRKDSLANQLSALGMTVNDFLYVALSHTHFDHTGTANAFKEATWLVQEAEYDFITSEASQKTNADGYNAIKELQNIKKLNGDFDVFGDGTVIIKSLPGHTPGHQALYLELNESGSVLLSGDMYHFNENRIYRRVPIFNFDVAQTQSSMEAFEAFAEEKGAWVILQHEKKDFESMPTATNFLQ